MDLYDIPDVKVRTLDLDVPEWIEHDISVHDVAAINQGGCASGAYMPAVTYHRAAETMAWHGDDIFDYLHDSLGAIPKEWDDSESWSGLACYYLSYAVELWAIHAANLLEERSHLTSA